MGETVRIPRALWEDPQWNSLTSGAQLLAITCMGLGKSGPCSATRVVRKTGWDRAFVLDAMAEIDLSPFAHVLLGRKQRRTLPVVLVRKVKDRDGWACVRCGSTRRLEIDHIYPVSRGGSDDIENLQTLCQLCNRRKGAKVDAMVQS